MLKFYDIDKKYIEFLKGFDNKIPNISYDSNDKFVCGVVLNINDVNYFAPISHNTTVYKTSFPITHKNDVIATIRFSFMFPADMSVLKEKKFDTHNNKYEDLLDIEWRDCNKHEKEIKQKALQVYKIGCNPHHRLNRNCCNFKLLEEKYKQYEKEENEKEPTSKIRRQVAQYNNEDKCFTSKLDGENFDKKL